MSLKFRIGIIGALWFLGLVNYLDRVAMSFAGPFVMKSLHMSPADFGILLSSFSVGYVLAQAPGGLIADRLGARVILVVGPMLWALFTGATGLVATTAAFVAVRLLFGLSEGLSNSAMYKVVGENFEAKERSRVLAISTTAYPLAPAFAGALIGKLIITFGWKVMFMILAGPALIAALACYVLLPAPTVGQFVLPILNKPLFRAVLAKPSLWLLSLAAVAWNINYWGFLGWMPSYLALARHIDLKAVGPLGGVPYIFGFLGMVGVGWLGSGPLHRFCTRLVIGCFLGAGLSLYLAYEASSVQLSLIGLSGAAFFMFGGSAPIGKILLDMAPASHRGAYVGVYGTVGQIGGVVAPVIIGLLVTATGSFASGFSLLEGSICVAAVLLSMATIVVRREWASDALAPAP
jgi:sugar phosphate permease